MTDKLLHQEKLQEFISKWLNSCAIYNTDCTECETEEEIGLCVQAENQIRALIEQGGKDGTG